MTDAEIDNATAQQVLRDLADHYGQQYPSALAIAALRRAADRLDELEARLERREGPKTRRVKEPSCDGYKGPWRRIHGDAPYYGAQAADRRKAKL